MQKAILKGSLLTVLVFGILLTSAVLPLTAKADSLSVSVTASPSSVSVGQAVTFTASATGATGAYTYIWSGDCNGSGATCQNTYSTPGNYTASVMVYADGVGITGSASVTVTGNNNPLSVSVSASPSSVSVGQTVTYSASATGGTGSYNYSWSGDCTGSGATCQNTYSTAGNYTASVMVYSGTSSQTGSANVTVTGNNNTALGVSVTASPNPANVNQTVTYSASPTGGTGSYTYIWSGDCTGSGATCQRSYSVAGNYNASVLVSSGGASITGNAGVTVSGGNNTALGVSVTASPNPANVNQTVTYSASPTGGTGSYTYIWSGDCTGSGATCQRSYSVAGNYNASVLVSSGGASITGNAGVTVSAQGNILCSTNAQCGTNGTTGGLFCQNNNVYQNYITYTCHNPGTTSSSCTNAINPQLVTTCTSGQTCSNGSCGNGNVLGVTVTVSPNPASTNQTVTFTATPTGGTGSYTYMWSGDCTGISPTCQRSYSTAGTYTASVLVVSGSAGITGTQSVIVNQQGNILCSTNAQCGTNGTTGGLFCQNNNVYQNYITYTCHNPGTTSSFCSNATNAQLVTTCTSGQTCSNGSCTTSCTPNFEQKCSGNNLYWYDSCGNQGNFLQYCANGCSNGACISNTLGVTVTVSPNPANVGQTVTFTAIPQGGNGTYSYTWSGDCTGSGATCQKSYPTSGYYTASVLLTSGLASVTGTKSVNVNQTGVILCSTNAQCGTNGATGGLFCQNNNVYQNYINYTCNNAGTTSSYCSSSINAQLVTTCTGNQVCSNGSCSSNNCTPNYQQKCFGNNLYWYDSCGIQGGFIQYCANGCNGNSCNNNNCTSNYQQRCSGNNLYWYDSCGNQQGLIQNCPNGCSGNVCQNIYPICSQNYQQRCSGSGLYWYDSCGNQGSFIQYCANGCNGNTCNNNNNYCTANYQERCVGNNLYWYDSCGNQQSLAQYCANGCYSNSCQTVTTSGTLFATKTVRNLTTGSGFAASTYASPSDTLMFMITLQASGNQDVQNVFVRDTLPANLIYNNQLVVARTNNASSNYSGDITYGINLGTIPSGQTVTITYQAKVAGAGSFTYGVTTLTNNVSVTSSNSGSPTANASVVVTKSTVLGASTVSTGLTNNFWVDSFFLPLLIALIGVWLWRSGMFFGIEKWLENKQKIRRTYKAEKELTQRIAQIRGAK